jgi:hypothetical protein
MSGHLRKGTYRWWLEAAVLVIIIIFLPKPVTAQEIIGQLVESEGQVSIDRPLPLPGQVIPVSAGAKEDLFEGDVVKTGLKSKAKIVLQDDSEIVLGEDGEMEIVQALFEPAAGRRSTTVRVFHGLARAVIPPIPNQKESSFTFETPTAVMGVRGSVGVTQVETEKAVLFCVEDTWKAKNIDPDVEGVAECPPEHMTEITKGKPPTKAVLIPAGLLAPILLQTTLGTTATAGGGIGLGTAAATAGVLGGVAGGTLAIIELADDGGTGGNGCKDTGESSNTIVNKRHITLSVRDWFNIDGDRIDLVVNGVTILSNVELTGVGQDVEVDLNCGVNTVDMVITDEGSVELASPELKVFDVISGKSLFQFDNVKLGDKTTVLIKVVEE